MVNLLITPPPGTPIYKIYKLCMCRPKGYGFGAVLV